jgi:hypothetical protein
MVLVLPLVRCHLDERRTPSSEPAVALSAVGPDKTKHSGYQTRASDFYSFEQELLSPCSIHVPTYFGDSTRKSTTSTI